MKPFLSNIEGLCNLPNSNGSGHYRSQLGRRGSVHLALDPNVESFTYAQPEFRYFDTKGDKRRYTGDTLVRFRSSTDRRPLVIEYRMDNAYELDPSLPEYYEVIGRNFKKAGSDFVVLFARDVLTKDFKVKQFILKYQNDARSPYERDVLDAARIATSLPLSALLFQLRTDPNDQVELLPVVWRLVATRHLFIDFSKMPCLDTIVSTLPKGGGPYDRCYK